MCPSGAAEPLRRHHGIVTSLSKEKQTMNFGANLKPLRGTLPLLVIAPLLLGSLCLWAAAPAQKAFPTAGAAWQAFTGALEKNDAPALKELLGTGSGDLISSGDPVADANNREAFLRHVKEKVDLQPDGADRVVVYVGEESWPFPIPIVKGDGGWYFDSATGEEEILNRRIGKNELYTIQVLRAMVDAQEQFAAMHKEPHYARRFFSSEGARDGLYWKAGEGEEESPLGPLAAQAVGEGYASKAPEGGGPRPFHGYLFRILTAQGKDAPGGEKSYLGKDGKMTGGFAFIAWPVQHGASGVMTFIVDRQGIVFQKDLGDKTAEAVQQIAAYDPDDSWSPAKD
jgi:hypothetical protein